MLAISGPAGRWDAVVQVAIWGAVLIAVMLALFVVVTHLRRRLLARRGPSSCGGLSIARIEALRQTGQISEEEFAHLRRIALGLNRAGPKKDDSALRPADEDDDETGGDE